MIERVKEFSTSSTATSSGAACESHRADLAALWEAVTASQAVIEFTPDGTILSANPNFLSALGYESSEVVGRHHRVFCDPEFTVSAEYSEFWGRLASGERQAGQFRRLSKDGHHVWIQASYTPVRGSDGSVTRVVKFATDITETKQRDLEREAKLQAIDRVTGVIEFTP